MKYAETYVKETVVMQDTQAQPNVHPAPLMREGTYRHITFQLLRMVNRVVAQTMRVRLAKDFPMQACILDWWEHYGVEKPLETWLTSYCQDGVIPEEYRPATAITACQLWRYAAIWMGVEWAGMNADEVIVRGQYLAALDEVFALQLQTQGVEPGAEQTGRNARRYCEALFARAETLTPAEKAQLEDILEVVAFITKAERITPTDIIKHINVLLGRLTSRLVTTNAAEQEEITVLRTRYEILAKSHTVLTNDLATARALAYLLVGGKDSATENLPLHELVQKLRTQMDELRMKALPTEAEEAPAGEQRQDGELRDLFDDLIALNQEIVHQRKELDRAQQALATYTADMRRAAASEVEDPLQRTRILHVVLANLTHATGALTEIQKFLDDLKGQHTRVVAQIEAHYAAAQEQRAAEGRKKAAVKTAATSSTTIRPDLATRADSFISENLLLCTMKYPLKGRYRYFSRLVGTVSNFFNDIASGAIVEKMDTWGKEGKIRPRGKRRLNELIDHVVGLPFFDPDRTPNEHVLEQHLDECHRLLLHMRGGKPHH